MAAFGPSSEGEITRHPTLGASWTKWRVGILSSMTCWFSALIHVGSAPKAEAIRASYLPPLRSDSRANASNGHSVQNSNNNPYAALAVTFGLQKDLPMRRKSNPKSSSSKQLSPRSAGVADIEMGRRIRPRRREIGISQTELAGKLGLSFQQMQKYEKGINRVGASRLQQIAEMLGVDVPFFYDGDGKQPDVDSLLVVNSVFSLRLLRAYTAIKDKTMQRRLVILVEMIAASQR